MHGITRRKALGGGAAFISLVMSIVLAMGLLASSAAITLAFDKVQVKKTADTPTINAGEVASFTIIVTTDAFPIDNVVLTDVLPAGVTWTVSGADAVAAGCAGVYAGGSTLTCNFGTIGDFGAPATKTIRVSGQTSAANCPRIDNTARVSTTEEDDNLSNNTSSASINVVCQEAPPSAKITPTGTTCEQFRDGTAADLNAIGYNLRSNGRIGNVFPGIGFYFVSLPAAGTYTISQTDNGNTPAFGTQSVQVYFVGSCERDGAAAVSNTAGGGATITVSGARIARLAFDPNTVVGTLDPAPQPTIVYTYTTSGVASSTDTINLTRSN